MVEFSIIIPVFNVEKYLRKCVDSILQQTFHDFEIIIVDDGSTDGSGVICDEYARNYFCIRTFHKKNGGLSSARNYGLENAEGRYYIFIDSDDYVADNMLETYSGVIKRYNEPDVICDNGMYIVREDGTKCYSPFYEKEFEGVSGKDALLKITQTETLWSACGKCYKSSFWKQRGFQYEEGIFSEDLDITYKIIFFANSFVMVKPSYYYRVTNNSSIMRDLTLEEKRITDYFIIFDRWMNFLQEQSFEDDLKDGIYRQLAMVYKSHILLRVCSLEKKVRKRMWDKVNDYKFLIKYLEGISGIIYKICLKVFGIKTVCFAACMLQKKKGTGKNGKIGN